MAKYKSAKIIAYIIIAVLVIYVICVHYKEGFEVVFEPPEEIYKKPLGSDMCPRGKVFVLQVIRLGTSVIPTVANAACYSLGITNVDRVFQKDNQIVALVAPKGYTVTLYSEKDGKGTILTKLSDESEYNECQNKDMNKEYNCRDPGNFIDRRFPLLNAKFKSIRVSGKVPYSDTDRDREDSSDSCNYKKKERESCDNSCVNRCDDIKEEEC